MGYLVAAEEVEKLLLEGCSLMMLGLGRDVPADAVVIRSAHGE
jgi:hypothetical protein